jgi:ornithine carbamoyltransferase
MPRSPLRGRSFVSVNDLSIDEMHLVLETAKSVKLHQQRGEKSHVFDGKTLGLVFQKPSLRTRVSFETAMNQCGGRGLYLSPGEVGLGERESVEDVAMVLSRFVDAIAARVFGHDLVVGLAKYATVPVINALSDWEHPCQALADLQTIDERKGRWKGLKMSFIGDGNNVAASLALACAKVGMHFDVASPAGYEMPAAIWDQARKDAQKTGAILRQVRDPREAAKGCDAFYGDVFTSMGQEKEREKRLKDFKGYQINHELLAVANPEALVLHCLPAHYGEEITYEASRLPQSAIFDQAENRLHAQKALLLLLMGY